MSVRLTLFGDPIKGAKKASEQSLIESCLKVVSKAVNLAPIDTGALRSSISWKTSTKNEGALDVTPKEYEAYVGTNLNYAVYVEYGTRTQAAQPFMRPAIGAISIRDTKIINAIQKAMIESAKKGIKNV